MKALTLHQPHATLMALGKKPWETRSWKAPASLIGKPLAIHAGKKFDREAMKCDRVLRALPRRGSDLEILPLGGIVAVVLLRRCRGTTERDRRFTQYSHIRDKAQDFGDFSEGRYVWETERLLVCCPHIVCRGYQGLWNVPANIAAVLDKEIK